MAPVGIHTSHGNIVFQNRFRCQVGDGEAAGMSTTSQTREANNSSGSYISKGIANHRASARALDDDVRFKPDRRYCAGMVGSADRRS
jgi:hypothetical protein